MTHCSGHPRDPCMQKRLPFLINMFIAFFLLACDIYNDIDQKYLTFRFCGTILTFSIHLPIILLFFPIAVTYLFPFLFIMVTLYFNKV